jgi:DNA repair protein RadC
MQQLTKVSEVQLTYKTNVKNSERAKVTSSSTCYDLIKPFFEDVIEYKEKFCVVLLNRNNKVLGVHTLSVGGTYSTVVDPKILFQSVILSNASAIILAHNHPSGTLSPSEDDKKITEKLKSGCNLFDISCLDHIILTDEGFYSFADNGLM